MVQMGFEPTPPKRLELESSALDRSATEPDVDKGVNFKIHFKVFVQSKKNKKNKSYRDLNPDCWIQSPE